MPFGFGSLFLRVQGLGLQRPARWLLGCSWLVGRYMVQWSTGERGQLFLMVLARASLGWDIRILMFHFSVFDRVDIARGPQVPDACQVPGGLLST
jgi:hypothetical protein